MVNGAVAHVGRDVHPAHRLDRDTSGCLCFALDKASARRLGASFQRNLVHKEYLAVVSGDVLASQSSRDFTVTARICEVDGDTSVRSTFRATAAGRGKRSRRCACLMDERGRVVLAAPRQADDGAHAPDPRPLRVDRPPARRRRAVQRCGARRHAAARCTRCGCGCRIPTAAPSCKRTRRRPTICGGCARPWALISTER